MHIEWHYILSPSQFGKTNIFRVSLVPLSQRKRVSRLELHEMMTNSVIFSEVFQRSSCLPLTISALYFFTFYLTFSFPLTVALIFPTFCFLPILKITPLFFLNLCSSPSTIFLGLNLLMQVLHAYRSCMTCTCKNYLKLRPLE